MLRRVELTPPQFAHFNGPTHQPFSSYDSSIYQISSPRPVTREDQIRNRFALPRPSPIQLL